MAYRIGIVGTGGIARAHGTAIKQMENVEFSAICDTSEEAINRYGDEFQVSNRYHHLEEMLDAEALDIVIVCTWGSHHAEVSNRVARTQKTRAILCEKPISSNAAECEEMIATARSNGVLLAEAFKFRHHPQHLKAKEIVESGEIGEVKCIRSTFTTSTRDPEAMTPDANWRFNREKGGGAVYDLGCYNIHHARYIIGAEPTCVYAVGDFGALSHVDEAVAVLLKFPGDVTAQFSLGFRYFGSQSTEIYGTQGFIKTELSWNNRTKPVSLEVCFQGGSTATYDFVPINQFVLQLEHLCECLETGVPHRIPPENSLGNMRVIDAIFESMGSGQPVGLKHNE